MLRSTASKVMWVGRATVFLVGLAVILALVFGVATAAFGANGGNFILGKTNVATLITRLGGPDGVNGAMFEVENNNAGGDDTALRLEVQRGEPPMKVNSQEKVSNLNADRLDGQDSSTFVQGRGKVYVGRVTLPTNSALDLVVINVPGFAQVGTVDCRSDGADVVLKGFDNTRGTLTIWRDTGADEPDYISNPGLISQQSNFRVTERTTWHLSVGTGSSAEAATIDVYTRVDGSNCIYSATAQVWGP